MGSLLLVLIYVSFISLGLPDSLLGSAWPTLHMEISVPISYAGLISAAISAATILSSLLCDKLVRKFGVGAVTAASTALSAIGLLGFSVSSDFWMLMLWAAPYGLGAGGVDALLNNYVALHYKAHHMNWLHGMWGVGASISPYIMTFSLVRLQSWTSGYLIVSVIQAVLSTVLFISVPFWKKAQNESDDPLQGTRRKPISLVDLFSVKGAVACFFMFFCYCSMEITASLWASTYFSQKLNFTPETAAVYASLFYIGMTVGRFGSGFLAMKLADRTLIRIGGTTVAVGIALLCVTFLPILPLIGFVLIGLGCAPVYPCIIHMTPGVFGKDKSQSMIGVQIAFAYIGFMAMPPLFGALTEVFSISILPIFLITFLVLMLVLHERVLKSSRKGMSIQ